LDRVTEKDLQQFFVEKLYLVHFLDFIWPWTLHLKISWDVVRLSFNSLGLDLDRKI